jgi:ribonuclease HII
MILGIDEAGRGPWAGPLVVGAVVLGGLEIEGLTDSKKLSAKKRAALEEVIARDALSFGLGWVSALELDAVGMSNALKLATIRAVEMITCSYSEIIIDGTVNFLSETTKGRYVKTMPKADLLIPSVSAASIIAKQARDAYMIEMAQAHPNYGFDAHMGYGTARHRAAIAEYGVTLEHRLSFAPLRQYALIEKEMATQPDTAMSKATTKQVGDKAEEAVVVQLLARGHRIVSRNWRTRVCEIDIVSVCDEALYFTEVKYRKASTWGDGLEVITSAKRRQMQYAAEVFLARHAQYRSLRPQLAVASVSGVKYQVDQWLTLE